jgi:hypothetical protein
MLRPKYLRLFFSVQKSLTCPWPLRRPFYFKCSQILTQSESMNRLPKAHLESAMCEEGLSASIHRNQFGPTHIAISRAAQSLFSSTQISPLLPVQNVAVTNPWLLWCARALYKCSIAFLQKLDLSSPCVYHSLCSELISHQAMASRRARALRIYPIAVFQKVLSHVSCVPLSLSKTRFRLSDAFRCAWLPNIYPISDFQNSTSPTLCSEAS